MSPKSPKLEDGNKLAKQLREDAEATDGPYLSAWDILAMERAERDVIQARCNLLEKQGTLTQVQLEHKLFISEAARKESALARDLERIEKFHIERQEVSQKLAESIARKYDFSWATHSYNIETGEVTET